MLEDQARLTVHQEQPGLWWLLLPGGPGMGSESLADLLPCLKGLGSVATLDLPDDGGHRLGLPITLERWQKALLEQVQHLPNVVLVGHSFGGMLIQTLPELQKHVLGMVLLNTAPDNQWFKDFGQRAKAHGLVNVSRFRESLLKQPSDEAYAQYMLHSLDYYFTAQSYVKGLILFQSLPFNCQAYLWAFREFHPVYQACYIPSCPLLIMSASLDFMTPAHVFDKPGYDQANISQVVIEQGAHFPWLEQPSKVRDAFQAFAKGL